jgi:sugar phosphate isomerase/epimerase
VVIVGGTSMIDFEVDVPSQRSAKMQTPPPGDPCLSDLSLNQRTISRWSVAEAISACVRYGIPSIGLWREPVAEAGLKKTVRMVEEAGLRVSSLCRAGFLTSSSREEATRAVESTVQAIDEAATLGAACLPIIAGGLPPGDTDIAGARRRFAQMFDHAVTVAEARGIRLAIEPLHPMFCADRSVIVTLSDALYHAEDYPETVVGVVVDSYNVWWDPSLDETLERAHGRIFGYQVSDWVLPLASDPLLSRGMMGDGFIDFRALGEKVAAAGYEGDVEVEIFNDAVWAADPEDAIRTVIRRHALHTHGSARR